MTLVNDYFHKVWIFFLKRKSEALKIFKIFREFSERLIGHAIKALHLDRGKFPLVYFILSKDRNPSSINPS